MLSTAYGTLSFFQALLLYNSIAVIFAGLMLSGDMAHELAKSWLRRYSSVIHHMLVYSVYAFHPRIGM